MLDITRKNGVLDLKNSGGGITLNGETPITLETLYKAIPIGKEIILYTTDHPIDLYGGGDWEQICECFTFAGSKLYDDNGNLISESNRTYKADGVVCGEFKHVLTVAEMPSHNHTIYYIPNDTNGWRQNGYLCNQTDYATDAPSPYGYINSNYTGGNVAHNNMPPYQVGYKWKRVG